MSSPSSEQAPIVAPQVKSRNLEKITGILSSSDRYLFSIIDIVE